MNNLPDGLPAARGRMTPTEEVSQDFAETYCNGSQPEAGGALHRNISQGQVSGGRAVGDVRCLWRR